MISPEDTYPGRATPADASYPEGSIKNETIPNSSDDGTPLDELWGNDFEGLKQAVARSASIVPTAPGNVPDTAIASQVLQGFIEMMQGRATTYDDTGAANAYVLAAQANQQEPASLFDGQLFAAIVDNTNTTASTIDLLGIATKNIADTVGGEIIAGNRYVFQYRLASDDIELLNPSIRGAIHVNTSNGYGSINTKIRRFTNVVKNQGSDITYADSATLGATFTINTAGVYSISYTEHFGGTSYHGITLDSAELTTNITNLVAPDDRLCMAYVVAGNVQNVASGIYLPAGSVIRPHTNAGSAGSSLNWVTFTITRVE